MAHHRFVTRTWAAAVLERLLLRADMLLLFHDAVVLGHC